MTQPPAPGPYGQQYPPGVPMAPPKKRGISTGAIVAIVLGAIVVLSCGVCGIFVAVSGNSNSGDSSSSSGSSITGKKAAIGEAVRDGKFEFVVKQQKCGVPKVGSDILGKTAQGQYCLITLNVKNIGNESQTFDSSSQKAKNSQGQEISADGTASIYANTDQQAFLNQINPGNQTTAVLVYDIPKNATLSSIELHDSLFSGGVTVALA
jgi:hypothetical protein